MYYIYHIEGVKIGCTKNPKRRFETPLYKKAVIIETHSDLDTADRRERELQIQYGYPTDKSTYKETLEFIGRAYTKTKRPVAKPKHIETEEERRERMIRMHEDLKQRGIGVYNKENSMKAGLVSKERYSIPILGWKMDTLEFIGEFTSAKAAGRELGIKNVGNIRNVLKGRGKSINGYTFQYKV
jgi:hypothetical protein